MCGWTPWGSQKICTLCTLCFYPSYSCLHWCSQGVDEVQCIFINSTYENLLVVHFVFHQWYLYRPPFATHPFSVKVIIRCKADIQEVQPRYWNNLVDFTLNWTCPRVAVTNLLTPLGTEEGNEVAARLAGHRAFLWGFPQTTGDLRLP